MCMRGLLTAENIGIFEMNKLLSAHIFKDDDVGATVDDVQAKTELLEEE